MATEELAIGIDLGTTTSCVAVYHNGKVQVLRNEHGNNITPSIVAFSDTDRAVGDIAKQQSQWNAENTVFGVKRLIGRRFDDPVIQNDIKHWPFEVVDADGKPMVKVRYLGQNKTFHPEEISAMVLEKMKSIAENYLGRPVKDAVITVPAYFDNNQRLATRAAGRIAGLNVLRLINEPTAAAIAYGLDKTCADQRKVLVYDLGGGTFDVSILTMDKGVFEVKATKGDTHLGGEDFDSRMVDYFAKDIRNNHGEDVFNNKQALRRLRVSCEKTKLQLSSSLRVVSEELANLVADLDYVPTMTRACFEEINKDLFEGTIKTVVAALEDSKFGRGDINDVVLVGGSTRIPKIQTMLKDFFQRQRLNKGINPDEAVAFGAAVQAAILSGCRPENLEGIVLYDVVPLSLGTDMIGGLMSTIIPRNSAIPIKKRETYTTTRENQTEMLVQVFEGERMFIKDNSFLGEMVLNGIIPEARGYAKVDVIFEIDDDCILHVKARDRDTGNERNLQILNNAKKLSNEQMVLLIQQAELYRLNDSLVAFKIGSLNDLEYYLNDIKCTLNDPQLSHSITDSQTKLVLNKIERTKDWINSDEGKVAKEKDYQAKLKEIEVIWNPIITLTMQASGSATRDNRPVIHLGD